MLVNELNKRLILTGFIASTLYILLSFHPVGCNLCAAQKNNFRFSLFTMTGDRLESGFTRVTKTPLQVVLRS